MIGWANLVSIYSSYFILYILLYQHPGKSLTRAVSQVKIVVLVVCCKSHSFVICVPLGLLISRRSSPESIPYVIGQLSAVAVNFLQPVSVPFVGYAKLPASFTWRSAYASLRVTLRIRLQSLAYFHEVTWYVRHFIGSFVVISESILSIQRFDLDWFPLSYG